MIKLILTASFTLLSMIGFAQEEKEIETAIVEIQDAFTEITLDKLPKAVTSAIKTGYPRVSIYKAYINNLKQYKMEVPSEAGEVLLLFMDAKGNWLEM